MKTSFLPALLSLLLTPGNANNAEQILGKLVTIRYETMANPSQRVVEFMKRAKLLAKK